jgi:hypothetical protein
LEGALLVPNLAIITLTLLSTMATLGNPALGTALPRRPVPLHGIRISMVLALAAASTALYYIQAAGKVVDRLHPDGLKGVPDPTWISVLWVALPLVPYLLSLGLLSTRSTACVAAGAGIAGGLFATLLILSPGMGAGLFVALGLSQAPYFFQIVIPSLVLLAISFWVVVAAVWTGKANWIVSCLAAGATFLCTTSGFSSLRDAGIEFHLEAEQQKLEDDFYRHRPRPIGARQNLMYLASCLFENHSAHPGSPYPRAIDPQTRWGCDTRFAEDMVPHFSISYTPQTNPVTGDVVDFQLVALPKKKGAASGNPLMIDHRGIVFIRDRWVEGQPYRIIATPGDGVSSQIVMLKANIERYMAEKNDGAAPIALSAEIIRPLPYETPTVDENGMYMEAKNFLYIYLAPKAGVPNHFGIIAQCQSYAENCLRSYYLDYDGTIHGTAEPRLPTREDPAALECEFVDSGCKDVSWYVR